MKLNRKTISNILFFGFIIFLFTPLGMGSRVKLTQGVTFVKTLIFPPSAVEDNKREGLDTYNFGLSGIANASDVNLESLKGKVILINHWATWCPPCRAEMPSLKSLYKDYSNNVEFLFLTSEDKSIVDKFYQNNNYKFPTYNMLSNPPKQITTRSLPATFILDKKGKVVLAEIGAADWNNSKVRKLLDKLINE